MKRESKVALEIRFNLNHVEVENALWTQLVKVVLFSGIVLQGFVFEHEKSLLPDFYHGWSLLLQVALVHVILRKSIVIMGGKY